MNFATPAFAVADRVATVTLNRPDKLNALSDEVVDELDRAVDAIRTRDDVAGAIITGAGPTAFVAAVNGFALGGAPCSATFWPFGNRGHARRHARISREASRAVHREVNER